ncbi:hypothetical protein T2812B_07435 [Thermotoga sp. 2812B]|nr:hypothetical protein T2812B_07435 [Thermotoga sp. 2812B]EJX25737.1 hypothetical protein EMP_08087 [Thermotoga sp. EMP]
MERKRIYLSSNLFVFISFYAAEKFSSIFSFTYSFNRGGGKDKILDFSRAFAIFLNISPRIFCVFPFNMSLSLFLETPVISERCLMNVMFLLRNLWRDFVFL